MGNYENLVENVRQFFGECAYLLCDGFGVNLGLCSIHPNVSGTFNSEKEAYNAKKNPIRFKYRTRLPLRNLVKHIAVEITGVADGNAFIDEFIDYDEETVNGIYTPGDMFRINGSKIKVAGDDTACGVFFVPVDDPTKAVKVKRIGENSPSTVTGITPNTHYQLNRIEIRTQFCGSNVLLKAPRTIVSSFIVDEL
jgi:hypothetical protein